MILKEERKFNLFQGFMYDESLIIHIYIPIYTHVCQATYIHIFIHNHACLLTCLHAYMCTYIHTYACQPTHIQNTHWLGKMSGYLTEITP